MLPNEKMLFEKSLDYLVHLQPSETGLSYKHSLLSFSIL